MESRKTKQPIKIVATLDVFFIVEYLLVRSEVLQLKPLLQCIHRLFKPFALFRI